jgi:hypothetical protein
MPSRSARPAIALALVLAGASSAGAGVWKRTRSDGTEEFTNVRPAAKEWRRVREPAAGKGVVQPPPGPAPARSSAGGGIIWGRENDDGTVEFTNLHPVGARWKVLYRTGPGKAAALRGPSDLVPPRDTSPVRFSRYEQHIRDQQAFFGIPPALMKAVIKVESDFDPRVVSSAGAVGLTQLMPATARSMGVTDIWDARQSIMGGARYLQLQARRYCRTPAAAPATGFVCAPDETVKVLAAYHAGPGAVDKYGGMPPYETTRSYVTTVLQRFEEYRRHEGPEGARPVAAR